VTTVLESTINRIVLLQTSQQLHIHSFTNDNFDTSTTQYTETELNKYYQRLDHFPFLRYPLSQHSLIHPLYITSLTTSILITPSSDHPLTRLEPSIHTIYKHSFQFEFIGRD
jgi:hypothetical protein